MENSAIRPEAVDLDAVVADRAAIWTAFADEQHVDIIVSGATSIRVWAVPGALEQIIDNLLSNALRVSTPGTAITLATVTARREGGRTLPVAELHVIDQGPGMTEAERQRAFDRFWRAPDADHDGTGLGLPMVQQLTRASGGEVTLEAPPAVGSTPWSASGVPRVALTENARAPLRTLALHSTAPPTAARCQYGDGVNSPTRAVNSAGQHTFPEPGRRRNQREMERSGRSDPEG
ncbi:sensor histidine kinase [Streptomyces chiangmaiensis]